MVFDAVCLTAFAVYRIRGYSHRMQGNMHSVYIVGIFDS